MTEGQKINNDSIIIGFKIIITITMILIIMIGMMMEIDIRIKLVK